MITLYSLGIEGFSHPDTYMYMNRLQIGILIILKKMCKLERIFQRKLIASDVLLLDAFQLNQITCQFEHTLLLPAKGNNPIFEITQSVS